MPNGRIVVSTFILLLSIVCPRSAEAWNGTGHELVAGIAWDNMTPAARQKAIELLEAAPENACLLDLFPNDARPLEVRQREFFMRAATWPDVIRPRGDNDSRRCTRFHQRDCTSSTTSGRASPMARAAGRHATARTLRFPM